MQQFEILTNLQKEHRLNHVENPPQLRLAPPAVYHEKVKKGIDLFSGESSGGKVQKGIDPSRGESSSGFTKIRKTSKIKQLREWKVKGSSIQLPLKSHIFGKLRYHSAFMMLRFCVCSTCMYFCWQDVFVMRHYSLL